MNQATPPRPGAFVPRPIHNVKPYGYVVERDDTPMGITRKFGLPEGQYRELVAANLYKRVLVPMGLGSPYACRTLGDLQENQVLRIPAHWPNPEGPAGVGDPEGPATLGAPNLDPVTAAMGVAMQSILAGGGGPAGQLPPGAESAALNAAVQWWYNTVGTAPASNPVQYVPYVTTALDWAQKYLPIAMGQGATLPQVSAFPWGPFLAALPAIPADLSKVDWSNGTIPGTNGVPWSSIPWGWLSQIGTSLEGLKIPPIAWPSNPTPDEVFKAWKTAVLAAMWNVGDACGANAAINDEYLCACKPGFHWASDDPNTYDCVADVTTPPITPSTPVGTECPAGSVYDPNGIVPGCYSCPDGFTYDLVMHRCGCPKGQTLVDGQCVPEHLAAKCPPGGVWDGQSCKPMGAPKNEVSTGQPSSALTTGLILGAIGLVVVGGATAIYFVANSDSDTKKR